MNVEILVLQALPTGLPGLRQSAIRSSVARRVNLAGGELPSKSDIKEALRHLMKKRVVHSERRTDPVDGFPYHVYWREAAYVAPLDVKVSL